MLDVAPDALAACAVAVLTIECIVRADTATATNDSRHTRSSTRSSAEAACAAADGASTPPQPLSEGSRLLWHARRGSWRVGRLCSGCPDHRMRRSHRHGHGNQPHPSHAFVDTIIWRGCLGGCRWRVHATTAAQLRPEAAVACSAWLLVQWLLVQWPSWPSNASLAQTRRDGNQGPSAVARSPTRSRLQRLRTRPPMARARHHSRSAKA